jgi:hypothetical protein
MEEGDVLSGSVLADMQLLEATKCLFILTA